MSMRQRITLASGHPQLRVGLAGIIALLAILAVGGSLLAVFHQHRIMQASRDEAIFDLGQMSVELVRLQLSIGQTLTGGDPKAAMLDYEIFSSRMNRRPMRAPTIDFGQDEIFDGLARATRAIAPQIEALPDPAAAQAAIDTLAPFTAPMLRVVSLSHSQAGDEVRKNERQSSLRFGVLCAVTLSMMLFGAVLLVFVFRQNRSLDRVVRIDALTGIANRHAFNGALSRDAQSPRAMVLIDVDHFKALNDTLGHEVGDRFLLELSKRVIAAASDAAMVARIGGDEFALLYRGRDAGTLATASCDGILTAMREPVVIDGRAVRFRVSLGVSLVSTPADCGTSPLFSQADIALYEAKMAGRDRVMVFHPDMNRRLVRRQRLRDGLRDAIEANELSLVFQPIVELATGRTRGFEALLRWMHPELGAISPVEFIAIAEECGEIAAIGRWVIDAACRQARLWPAATFIAVNVSAAQLTDALLVDHIGECLARHGIAARRLEIEITESTLIQNDERAVQVLHALHRMGCRVSLDDFGTGHASLSYLLRFPFDKIKIDQSFLRCTSKSGEGVAIITATCDLARRLRLDIVAEGVETHEHHQIVMSAGCDMAQGYLFDRPLSPEHSVLRLVAEDDGSLLMTPPLTALSGRHSILSSSALGAITPKTRH